MDFLGLKTFERSAGGFKFGMWVANTYGDQITDHCHKSAHFMWIMAGAYETKVSRYRSDNSDIVVFNPAGTEHNDRFISPGIFFSLKVTDDTTLSATQSSVIVENAAIRSLFWRMCLDSECWENDSSMIIEGLCYESLSMVSEPDSKTKMSPSWLDSACQFLRDDPNSTIADAAREAGLHPTHYVRAFKNSMKCTPGEYRRLAKLQAAASKITGYHATLAEVAAEAGFSDQSHFTKHFRRAFGLTPGAFRSVKCQ